MLNIEYHANLDEKYYKIIDTEFNKFAKKNDVICNYTPFAFVAMEDNKFIGIITGNSYYKEIHINDLIVLEEYRNKKIGTELVKAVEDFYRDKGFENINLTTYGSSSWVLQKIADLKLNLLEKTKKILNLINIF